jgi:hypothetical protein
LVGRVTLAVGAVGVLAYLLPIWPRERAIELRLDDPRSVLHVDVAWSRGGDEAVRGASWTFSPGAAPATLETSVSLPNGTYDLDVTLRRVAGSDSLRRRVTLDDTTRIAVFLR